jgi:hypothetical protein
VTIPKFVKIAGHQVNITYPYLFKERTDLCAQSDFALMEIRLSECDRGGVCMADSRLKMYLLTEIIRGILKWYCPGANIPAGQVVSYGNGWYQVLSETWLEVGDDIPSFVRVAGHLVEIVYPRDFSEDHDLYARAHVPVNQILLGGKDAGGNGLAKSFLWATLLHEIHHYVHAAYCAMSEDDDEKVERVADAMGDGLYQVLADNPHLEMLWSK